MEVNRQAEDRYSDASSGDTGTSDSGRGGSEDESHGHSTSSGVEGKLFPKDKDTIKAEVVCIVSVGSKD